jgi:hypothetical protein
MKTTQKMLAASIFNISVASGVTRRKDIINEMVSQGINIHTAGVYHFQLNRLHKNVHTQSMPIDEAVEVMQNWTMKDLVVMLESLTGVKLNRFSDRQAGIKRILHSASVDDVVQYVSKQGSC